MDKDPYAEGVDAFIAGKPETANPYGDDDFDAHCSWNDGWTSAQDMSEEE